MTHIIVNKIRFFFRRCVFWIEFFRHITTSGISKAQLSYGSRRKSNLELLFASHAVYLIALLINNIKCAPCDPSRWTSRLLEQIMPCRYIRTNVALPYISIWLKRWLWLWVWMFGKLSVRCNWCIVWLFVLDDAPWHKSILMDTTIMKWKRNVFTWPRRTLLVFSLWKRRRMMMNR